MKKNIEESQTVRSIGEGVKDALSEENIFTSVDAIYEERKRRKEAFRVLHEEAKTANEDVMKRFYGLLANHTKPVRIDEATLERLLKKHGGDGMVDISANKAGLPQEMNDENTKSLISDLKQSGFLYLPTYEGYRIENGVEDDYEPSFVVFNHDAKGNAGNFDELKQFALAMCRKYNQDSVLVKAPGQSPVWLDKDGNTANARESDANRNGCTCETGLNECYVNPIPCQLSERMRRVGEVMIWE